LGEKDPAERFVRVYSVFSHKQKAHLYNQDWLPRLDQTTSAIRVWQHEVAHLDGLAQMMYVDARFSLSDDLLLYGDKMSMAVSLEARVPMLDLELMSFIERLPSQMRLKGCTHKYLYRKAISAWLPLEVLRRPKRGFDTPMDKWLAGDLQSYARALWFASDSASRIYFNMVYLDQLLHEHASGRVDHRRQIYSLLSFEIWHRLFVTI
jgi:asparagine synthase (glutamine-hydrolysing)